MINNTSEKFLLPTMGGARCLYNVVFTSPICAELLEDMGVSEYPSDLRETVEYLLSQPTFHALETWVYHYRFDCHLSHKDVGIEMSITPTRVHQIELSFLKKMKERCNARLLALGIIKFQLLDEKLEAENQFKDASQPVEQLKATIERYKQATNEMNELRNRLEHTELLEARKNLENELYASGLKGLRLSQCHPYKTSNDNTPIEMAFPTLSARSYNALRCAGIMTIGQLKERDYAAFARIRNFGKTSQMEVMKSLKAYDGSVLVGTPEEIALNL